MMKDRKLIVCFMLICFFSPFFSIHHTEASSSVNIKVEASTYANLYYEILYDGKRIDKDIEFGLYDEKGRLVGTYQTNNGILLIKKMPFGNYILKPKGYKKAYSIKVDKEYLKTQHILKPLELKENEPTNTDATTNPQTGDNTNILLYLMIFITSGSILAMMIVNEIRSKKNGMEE